MKYLILLFLLLLALLILLLYPFAAGTETYYAHAEVVPVIKEIPLTTEQEIRKEFSDIPEMIEVARCESKYRQFGTDRKSLKGTVNPDDIGALQINQRYHRKDAESEGIDIDTLEGNLKFGRELYESQGLKPWIASKSCWS